jgi:hypothetical protein
VRALIILNERERVVAADDHAAGAIGLVAVVLAVDVAGGRARLGVGAGEGCAAGGVGGDLGAAFEIGLAVAEGGGRAQGSGADADGAVGARDLRFWLIIAMHVPAMRYALLITSWICTWGTYSD